MVKRRTLDEVNKLPSTIDRHSVYVGNIRGQDNYVVHGEVVGNAEVDGALMLGPTCVWKGHIRADVVIVKGRVEGNIYARQKLELRSTAQVQGDLNGPLIAIAEGATVQGSIQRDSLVTRFTERRMH